MIAELKPYPACKNSGVPWLGEVPEHWEIRTLRRTLRSYNGIKIGPFGSQLKLEHMSPSGYKVYGQANVIASDFARGIKFIDQKKYAELSLCELRPNDLVMTMMGTGGRCARVPNNATPGIMDSHLLRLRTDATIYTPFAALILDQAPYVKEQINMASKGSIMQGLNSSIVKDIVLSLPPLLEQAAIVRFLDHIDRRIRRYISAKQKLIKLLEEQKQAIIHRAVTRGLDPNVRLNPSGVGWLGDVPEHWEVRRLKQAFRRIVGGSTPSSAEPKYWDGDVVWVTPSDISRAERLKSSLRRITQEGLKSCSSEFVPPGSIIVTSRAPVGNVALADVELCTNQGCKALVTTDQVVNPMFGFAVLRMLKGELQSLATGTTFTEISTTKLGIVPIPLPPILEQTAIVRYLDNTTSNITTAIDHAQREMSFLREYRTRLIADVVTGNVDVREAAERLPDEAEETEFINDTVAIAEEEEGGEDQVGDPPPEEDANG